MTDSRNESLRLWLQYTSHQRDLSGLVFPDVVLQEACVSWANQTFHCAVHRNVSSLAISLTINLQKTRGSRRQHQLTPPALYTLRTLQILVHTVCPSRPDETKILEYCLIPTICTFFLFACARQLMLANPEVVQASLTSTRSYEHSIFWFWTVEVLFNKMLLWTFCNLFAQRIIVQISWKCYLGFIPKLNLLKKPQHIFRFVVVIFRQMYLIVKNCHFKSTLQVIYKDWTNC